MALARVAVLAARGPIYATPATRDLCAPMLEDAASVQLADARHIDRLIALDPSAPPVPEETVTVEGALTCPECNDAPRIEVRVGDARVTTDDKGHFSLTAKGRGKLALMWLNSNIWQRERAIDPAKHAYKLGKLEVHPPPEGD